MIVVAPDGGRPHVVALTKRLHGLGGIAECFVEGGTKGEGAACGPRDGECERIELGA